MFALRLSSFRSLVNFSNPAEFVFLLPDSLFNVDRRCFYSPIYS